MKNKFFFFLDLKKNVGGGNLKENPIGSAISEILQYRQTNILLFNYKYGYIINVDMTGLKL